MSYRNLQIWQLARLLVIDVHNMSLNLPVFEKFEVGSQIRRSVKSVKSNIVEGYGRRRYKQEYIRFMVFALSSNDETIDHLETLYETKSLKNEELYQDLHKRTKQLGIKINNFLQSIEKNHNKFDDLNDYMDTK
ncbi:four helix bundle protein [Aequorivita vladivostokensis]|uniref:S23 ribosomal protein n=1 Tax=Aequorivita vladivostokensis TaxID=171194 RepID=A0ABR5DLM9_9FLAO|nr:four helix bundle protein [Aequorivita vladivostokensis]KJJ39675.1 S23 ribosomal protein [Aequorivita vladivostokensis]